MGKHADVLERWCRDELGAAPRQELFRTGHLSEVVGIELADGRRVVVKVRPASPRVAACVRVQRHLHGAGFPCPEPIAGPAPFGQDRIATAERWVPYGDAPPAPVPHAECAALLARLVALAPPVTDVAELAPAPPWVAWDHGGSGVWPWPDDLDIDMNDHPGPDWVDDVGAEVAAILCADDAPPVVGHVDFEAHNLGWHRGAPAVVHDWDSAAIRTEAAIVGVAAATFPTGGEATAATVAETESFLDAYGLARERRSIAWAAGLWVLAYNAKKESLGAGPGYLVHLERELDARLQRMRYDQV